jgi:hypothetical protein
MKLFMVIPYYLSWHYSRGLAQWTHNLLNFITFEFHFFSVKDLLLNLFAPFQRLRERYDGNPVDFEAIFSVVVVNLIMRAVGLFVRLSILTFASIAILVSLVLVLVLILFWLVLPVALVALLLAGGGLIFKYNP